MKDSKKLNKLKKLYNKIPNANCKGLCHEACAFIMCAEFEQKNIESKYGSFEGLNNPCPKLVNGRCSIYEDRPMVCRMYGVVPGLMCQFGCVPDSILSATQASKIFNKIGEL